MKNWNLLKPFGTVSDGCFTEEPEQKIKVLRKLNELLIFSAEPDDLNEQLVELEAEDSKTYSMICRFIKAHYQNKWSQPL